MAWPTTSSASRGYGSKWRTLRLFILERDERRCHVCHGPGADTVDHVRPKSQGGTDHPANLAAIHEDPCHKAKTKQETQAAAKAKPTAKRRSERHPGLV